MLVPEVTPDNAVTPLDTLDQLLNFKSPPLCAVQPLRDVARGRPEDPKTLLCHDHIQGCYQQDRFVHGCANPNSYRFYHWQVIDSFAYYSHYMVTIPPPGWISAAHRHGVKVLGTFFVKSREGAAVLDRIRQDDLLSKVASQLALIAALSQFDGWLIDIESKVEKCHVGFLKDLLLAIATQTHQSVPGSLIIWYDSVVNDGVLDWQSELNEKNCDFFDLCDGIFLNSRWTEDMLQQSAFFAGARKSDVYVGIDVYARMTSYIGGFETYRVVDTARRLGLSAAIFGASWAYEANDKRRFAQNQGRLWSFPDYCCPKWRLKAPPISTSFCQGFGYSLYKEGQVVSTRPWFDLSKQQLQPHDQGTWLCQGCGSAIICTDDAYNGGGCLRLRFLPDPQQPDAVPYFRLFDCDFSLGRLAVSYTFKQLKEDASMENDVTLVLRARTGAGERGELQLGIVVVTPDERYAVARDVSLPSFDDSMDTSGYSWVTRRYNIEDLRTATDCAILEEIGISFVSTQANVCLLGKLVVEWPRSASGNQEAAAGNDGNASDDSGPDAAISSDEFDGEEASAS
ncbi:cytosolic endo-beta-N-acetylglucosaminidase isoform X1 [Rhipicephalus sanguineus]|uniref:cytosolic endo-beta-N-acetylglucosaminidase isoform X1 n=2 Tax=Rhipicephalus sanguineus TaxID=34632 RepID=UPI001893D1C6|nr:cytosolic endo-beta-N-acetylglucosaminidase isoform X1 [Rhipicephalus sanguineus]